MPDPATTPAHEGGEREMDIDEVSAIADGTLRVNPDSEGLMKELARDWLAQDAEITRLREALELAFDCLTMPLKRLLAAHPEVACKDVDETTADVIKKLSAALAGTSADAGARETVTVAVRSACDMAEVLRRVTTWVSATAPHVIGDHVEFARRDYLVAITVTPGKERGT